MSRSVNIRAGNEPSRSLEKATTSADAKVISDGGLVSNYFESCPLVVLLCWQPNFMSIYQVLKPVQS